MIDAADVVVIGAGAFGASVAYHLARLGQRNVVLPTSLPWARRRHPAPLG